MTLLYMYFENGGQTYKGIKPNPKGYVFDSRFDIEFDKEKTTFNIKDNDEYVQIYNSAISNISCIVGKNGSGKTTFIELLLSNIVWGMTHRQPKKMISIYYTIDESGKTEFFIHLFKTDGREHKYKLFLNSKKQELQHKHHTSSTQGYQTTYHTSTMPENTKFIFHSLSPFDKIFYSIGQTLKDNSFTTSHYTKQMNYIGTQSFFKDEVAHEIQTISNLIRLFTSSFSREPFENALGYTFSELSISFENKTRSKIDDLESYVDNIENALDGYKNINKYPLLIEFKKLKQELKVDFFSEVSTINNYSIETGEDLLCQIIMDSIDFQRLIYVTNLNRFLELIQFSSKIYTSKSIKQDVLMKNISNIKIKNKKLSFLKNIDLLNNLFNNQNILNSIIELSSITLTNIDKLKNIEKLNQVIKLIRKLQHRGYLYFQLDLKKDGEEVNYFFLSSGEKTMMSYFANLIASVNEFKDKKNNTFIIFIDEVELHLHPEWQRSFIDYMDKFFRKNELNIKFQFIIATHSPFILSDIVEEQIIFINEDEKKSNNNNTFGANIYDIFEKGFFLENSIGKCSENYIHELSNTIYLFKALQHIAEHQDYFLIRNFLQMPYMIDQSKKTSVKKQKEEEDATLLHNILNELKNKDIILLKDKVSINSIETYIDNEQNSFSLKEKIIKHIEIIGEPTVKVHLNEIYDDVKEFEINAN